MAIGFDQPNQRPRMKATTRASLLNLVMLTVLAPGILGQLFGLPPLVRTVFSLAASIIAIVNLVLIRKAQAAGEIPTPPDAKLLKIARIGLGVEVALTIAYLALIAIGLAFFGPPPNLAVILLPGLILALAMTSTGSTIQKYRERIARSQSLADEAENARFNVRQRTLTRRSIGALVLLLWAFVELSAAAKLADITEHSQEQSARIMASKH